MVFRCAWGLKRTRGGILRGYPPWDGVQRGAVPRHFWNLCGFWCLDEVWNSVVYSPGHHQVFVSVSRPEWEVRFDSTALEKLSPEEKQVLVTACLLARILRDNSPCSLILSVTTNVKVCPKNPSSQHFSGFSSATVMACRDTELCTVHELNTLYRVHLLSHKS